MVIFRLRLCQIVDICQRRNGQTLKWRNLRRTFTGCHKCKQIRLGVRSRLRT